MVLRVQKARITEDGKYMIAASQTDEKSFRVRQYDIKNAKVFGKRNTIFINPFMSMTLFPSITENHMELFIVRIKEIN